MENVKEKRYVSGEKPDYAPVEPSDEADEEFQFIKKEEAEPEGRGRTRLASLHWAFAEPC